MQRAQAGEVPRVWGGEKGLESRGQPKESQADFNRLPLLLCKLFLKRNNLSVVTTTKHPESGARLPQA